MMAPVSGASPGGVNLTQKHIHTHHSALRQHGLAPQGIVSTNASAKLIASSPSFAAIERDLRGEADTLRRELARKDSRNDALTKELQELRTSNATAQRELRNLTGTFDKLNAERHTLTSQLQKSKEYGDLLETKLARLGDNILMGVQIEHLQTIIAGQGSEMGSLRNKVGIRDDRIRLLERELDVMHRSLEAQRDFEGADRGCHGGGSCGCGGGGLGKEKMRSLYYELGKKQSDNHSLALSLAESHNACDRLKAEVMALQQVGDDKDNEVYQLKAQNELMLSQSRKGTDDLSSRESENNSLKEINVSLQRQIEDSSYRFSEYKSQAERDLQEKVVMLTETEALLLSKRAEAEGFRSRLDSLQQAMRQMESVSVLSEQRLRAEWERMAADKAQLADTIERDESSSVQISALETEVIALRGEREDIARKNKQLMASYEAKLGEERNDIDALSSQVHDAKKQLSIVCSQEQRTASERDEAMKALLQTVEAARELSVKLQKERSRRVSAEERAIAAERAAESMKKSKENVSTAVLDALHKERSKTLALEQALNSLSVDRRYSDYITIPTQQPGSNTIPPSPEPLARMPPMPSFSTSSAATPMQDMNSIFDGAVQQPSTPAAAAHPPVVGMVEELRKLRAELSNLENAALSPLSESFR